MRIVIVTNGAQAKVYVEFPSGKRVLVDTISTKILNVVQIADLLRNSMSSNIDIEESRSRRLGSYIESDNYPKVKASR